VYKYIDIVNDISVRLPSPRFDFDCLPERADYEMLNRYVPDITIPLNSVSQDPLSLNPCLPQSPSADQTFRCSF
jgi:hypothetical protein